MKKLTAFRLSADILAAMAAVKVKEGIPLGVQVETALREWLGKRGYKLKETWIVVRPSNEPS